MYAWSNFGKLQSDKPKSLTHVAMTSQDFPLGPLHCKSLTQALGFELGAALGDTDMVGPNDRVELGKKLGTTDGVLEIC